jgi:hypothetical protein
LVLERYAQSPVLDELPLIFPEAFAQADPEERPLEVLARIALASPRADHQMFAMECLRHSSNARGGEASPWRSHLVKLYNSARPGAVDASQLDNLSQENEALKKRCAGLSEEQDRLRAHQQELYDLRDRASEKEGELKKQIEGLKEAHQTEKRQGSLLRNTVEAWNGSSWFNRAFHKLRLP